MKKQKLYNRIQKKYEKLNQKIQKAIQTGRFYTYTKVKQEQLLSRLKCCLFQLKHLAAEVAVVAVLAMSAPAVGQAQNFIQKVGVDNPFDGFHFGNNKKPQFIDVDVDGDLDMFLGNKSSSVDFYRNTGTNTEPLYVKETGANNPLNMAHDFIYISFVDLDNDGDMDMFGGKYTLGNMIQYYENTGAGTTQFVQHSGSANPLNTVIQDMNSIPHSIFSTYPFFVDLDNDGDQDCFVAVTHYETDTYVDPYDPYNVIYDYENVITIRYYENTGTVSSPSFTPRSGVNNPLSSIEEHNTPSFVSPGLIQEAFPALEFADLDNDGDQDCFFSNNYRRNTKLSYYENTGTATNSIFNLNSYTPLNAIGGVNNNAVISLVDIDSDGDLDVYTKNGDVYTSAALFYENQNIVLTANVLENTGLNALFSIYPNPSQGTLNFSNPLTGELTLYGTDGKEIFSQQIENSQVVNLPSIEGGLYTLVIQTAKERINKTVLIKR